jgi:hypothetical protein
MAGKRLRVGILPDPRSGVRAKVAQGRNRNSVARRQADALAELTIAEATSRLVLDWAEPLRHPTLYKAVSRPAVLRANRAATASWDKTAAVPARVTVPSPPPRAQWRGCRFGRSRSSWATRTRRRPSTSTRICSILTTIRTRWQRWTPWTCRPHTAATCLSCTVRNRPVCVGLSS